MRILKHPILNDIEGRKEIHIIVDGRKIKAYEEESIAAALFAEGIMVHRTTVKYNEPRGVFCNKGRCTDCIMRVDGRPNVRTCITKVRDGMIVESINGLGKWEALHE
jgi:predicted molibdopterin-dependent oxidoreductase YjgC